MSRYDAQIHIHSFTIIHKRTKITLKLNVEYKNRQTKFWLMYVEDIKHKPMFSVQKVSGRHSEGKLDRLTAETEFVLIRSPETAQH